MSTAIAPAPHRRAFVLHHLFCAALLAAFGVAAAQDSDDAPATGLSPEVLQSRIDQLQGSSAFDEPTRIAALEYYQRALTNLAAAAGHDVAADRLRRSIIEAPAETERVRAAIAAARDADPLDGMAVTGESAATDIEQLLSRERAAEASARALVAEFRQRLSSEETRPQAARERIRTATEELRAVTDSMAQSDATADADIVVDARRAADQAADTALRAEILMLEQEVLSHSSRIVLLQAETERASLLLDQQQQRVRALQEILSERRRDETNRILEELGLDSLGVDVSHALVEQLISENGELADELDELTVTVEELSESDQAAVRQLDDMRQRFERARSRLEVAGIGQALGRYLAQQRRDLPSLSDYQTESRLREDEIAELSIRNINLGERSRALRDVESYVDERLAPVPADEAERLRPVLLQLVESQNRLLQQLIGLTGSYLRLLADSGYTQSQLFEVISEFRVYLAEHLMWVRSRGAFGLADVVALPGEFLAFLEPGRWAGAARVFVDRLSRSPLQIAALLILLLFYWKQASLHTRLRATSAKVNKPSEDLFSSTIKAVALTVVMTLPWPLFMAITGYEMLNAPGTSNGTLAIGIALLQVSPLLLVLTWFRMLCAPGGVAEGHFRWTPEGVAILRRQFGLLTVALLLPAFVLIVNRELDETGMAGGLNQILLLIFAGALTLFFFRLLRPQNGIAQRLQRRPGSKPIVRFPRLAIALATLIPLAVGIMSLAGFMFSAGTLLSKMFYSVLLLLGFVIIRELTVRWLLVIKRRLLLREALQRREAAAREASGETSTSDESPETVEDSVADIASLDANTRKLVNVALVIALILGIAGIWSSVLPALGIFRDITLWHYIATVGGEATLNAVTLVDLFVAAIVIVVTVVSARNIPSLIEIVLRQRPSVKPGSRLAFATLTRYTIATIGIVATLSIVGVNWSKLQWLVAGLTVGIGFGLRDIIGSFVSGLIILIERPIRVGDMVSVGNVSGTVSRIQIRATTIRTFDRTELLVPNTEFVANHVLNWSLSDEIMRLSLTVGIAYGSDVEKALRLMKEAALEHSDVIDEPEPLVTFEEFGDNALVLGLRCFIQDLNIRLQTKTDLHRAINRKFEEAAVSIASPQRDLHLDTASPLEIRLLQGASTD